MIKSYIFTQIKKFISQKVLERTKIDVVCDNAFVTLSVRVHRSDLEGIFESSIPDEVSKADVRKKLQSLANSINHVGEGS